MFRDRVYGILRQSGNVSNSPDVGQSDLRISAVILCLSPVDLNSIGYGVLKTKHTRVRGAKLPWILAYFVI